MINPLNEPRRPDPNLLPRREPDPPTSRRSHCRAGYERQQRGALEGTSPERKGGTYGQVVIQLPELRDGYPSIFGQHYPTPTMLSTLSASISTAPLSSHSHFGKEVQKGQKTGKTGDIHDREIGDRRRACRTGKGDSLICVIGFFWSTETAVLRISFWTTSGEEFRHHNIARPPSAPSEKKQNCALRKEPVPSEAEGIGTAFFRKVREGRATRPNVFTFLKRLASSDH
jgi:hypothetical protein